MLRPSNESSGSFAQDDKNYSQMRKQLIYLNGIEDKLINNYFKVYIGLGFLSLILQLLIYFWVEEIFHLNSKANSEFYLGISLRTFKYIKAHISIFNYLNCMLDDSCDDFDFSNAEQFSLNVNDFWYFNTGGIIVSKLT